LLDLLGVKAPKPSVNGSVNRVGDNAINGPREDRA